MLSKKTLLNNLFLKYNYFKLKFNLNAILLKIAPYTVGGGVF